MVRILDVCLAMVFELKKTLFIRPLVYHVDEGNPLIDFYYNVNEWLQDDFNFWGSDDIVANDGTMLDDFINFECIKIYKKHFKEKKG